MKEFRFLDHEERERLNFLITKNERFTVNYPIREERTITKKKEITRPGEGGGENGTFDRVRTSVITRGERLRRTESTRSRVTGLRQNNELTGSARGRSTTSKA